MSSWVPKRPCLRWLGNHHGARPLSLGGEQGHGLGLVWHNVRRSAHLLGLLLLHLVSPPQGLDAVGELGALLQQLPCLLLLLRVAAEELAHDLLLPLPSSGRGHRLRLRDSRNYLLSHRNRIHSHIWSRHGPLWLGHCWRGDSICIMYVHVHVSASHYMHCTASGNHKDARS